MLQKGVAWVWLHVPASRSARLVIQMLLKVVVYRYIKEKPAKAKTNDERVKQLVHIPKKPRTFYWFILLAEMEIT